MKKKVSMLKGEKFLYFMIGLLLVGNILGQAFSSALYFYKVALSFLD